MRFKFSLFILWCVLLNQNQNSFLPQEDVLLYFLLFILQFFLLCLGLQSILNQYLHEVKVKIHFLPIWRSSYSSSICCGEKKTKPQNNYLFSIELLWLFVENQVDYLCVGLILNYLFCSIELCVYLHYLHLLYNFIVSLESR